MHSCPFLGTVMNPGYKMCPYFGHGFITSLCSWDVVSEKASRLNLLIMVILNDISLEFPLLPPPCIHNTLPGES